MTSDQTVEAKDLMVENITLFALTTVRGRAMSRVTDGLKPVHRRILYVAMKYKERKEKAAKLVGETMGNFHPHGDSAIYDAMARMTQSWISFVPVIEGGGSWGSIDGDNPAAMRYTEAVINRFGVAMFDGIDSNAVDFVLNYDQSMKEPVELPVPFPYIFMIGTQGIATGFTHNIPTHHPVNVCQAVKALLLNPQLTNDELFDIMPPAFPTPCIITNMSNVRESYRNGSGSISVAAHISLNHQGLLIEGVPYGTTTSNVVRSIQDATDGNNPTIPEIKEIYPLKKGSVQIILKQGSDAASVIRRLYQHTLCQRTQTVQFCALDRNNMIHPEYRPLTMLQEWVMWRYEVLIRINRFEYGEMRRIIHLKNALLQVVRIGVRKFNHIIETNDDEETVKTLVMQAFLLDREQVEYIISLPIRTLIRANIDKIAREIVTLTERMKYHELRLSDPTVITGDMLDQMDHWIEYFQKNVPPNLTKYTDWNVSNPLDNVACEDTLILITAQGHIRRIDNPMSKQRRGGKGTGIGKIDDGDAPVKMLHATTHQVLIFFTNHGRLFVKAVHEIPKTSKNCKSIPLNMMLQLRIDETVCQTIKADWNWNQRSNEYLIMATASGIVKKTECIEFANVRADGIRAINIQSGDRLVAAELLELGSNNSTIMLTCCGASEETGAACIRFRHEDVRPTSRTSAGVIGINLDGRNDAVQNMILTPEYSDNQFIMTVTTDGRGKLTPLNEYEIQSRSGKGRILCRKNSGEYVTSSRLVERGEVAIMISNARMIMLNIDQINIQGRATLGVRCMDVAAGERVVHFTTTDLAVE